MRRDRLGRLLQPHGVLGQLLGDLGKAPTFEALSTVPQKSGVASRLEFRFFEFVPWIDHRARPLPHVQHEPDEHQQNDGSDVGWYAFVEAGALADAIGEAPGRSGTSWLAG